MAESLARFLTRMRVPGVAAALVGKDQLTVDAAGTTIRGGTDPATTDHLWHIGSCAKAMTAALIGRYVEEGRTAWEAPVPEFFPDTITAWRGVTLAQILTHRAGLPSIPGLRWMKQAYRDQRPLVEQRAEVAARTFAAPPGRVGRFRYSNLGYALAGAIVDRLAGRPYEEAITADLLGPLGIHSPGFGPPPPGNPLGHRPRLIAIGRGPAIPPGEMGLPHPADNPPVLNSAGRLHLTIGDWAAFVRMFLEPFPGPLAPDTIVRLTTPASGPGPEQAMGWAIPRRSGLALGAQGSNRRWSATVLIGADRRRAALVVANDGRSRVLAGTASLARRILEA